MKTPKILLVSTNKNKLGGLGRLLKEANFEVTDFTYGLAAWNAFRHQPHQYDLVVTEARLQEGGLDGLALTRMVKGLRTGVPVVVMGRPSGDEPNFKEIVPDFFLPGIFSSSCFMEAVRWYLKKVGLAHAC